MYYNSLTMTASGNPVNLVAIGGLVITALGLLYLVLKDRRKVSVKAEDVASRGLGDFEAVLGVTVVNTGHRPITIIGFSLDFSDKHSLISGVLSVEDSDVYYRIIDRTADSDDINKRIDDGESMRVFFDYNKISQFMTIAGSNVELKAIYAHDAKHGTYKAKVPKYLKRKINKLGDRFGDDSS